MQKMEEQKKSTHRVEVVPVVLEPHENADSLSLVHVYGYTCVVKTEDWKNISLAAYVPPDSVVSLDRSEFSFLDKNRITVRKFRGIFSQGLLVPAPAGSKLGDDVSEILGVTRYEPPEPLSFGGENVRAPAGVMIPKYDVESWNRYKHIFSPDDEVVVTEKIHGCVSSSTRISMIDGTRKFIRNIEEGEELLGVDEHNKVIPSKVIKKYRNGKTKTWLKITSTRDGAGRGNSFSAIKCTPEHRFWDPVINQFKEAKNLKAQDSILVLRSELGLTPIHEQVLLGMLLGDAAIHVAQHTAAVYWGHKKDHKEYMDWIDRALGEISLNKMGETVSGYGTLMLRSQSIYSYWIKKKFESFISNSGKKCIPNWVENELSPISLAFLYMDDGSLTNSNGQEDRASFALCNFSERDCLIFIKGLSKLGLIAKYSNHGNYSRVGLDSGNAERFFLLIAPYLPPVLQYKLPERYRGNTGWIPNSGKVYKQRLVKQTILSIEIQNQNSEKFDLETTTNNYFANGILVHNSNARFTFHDGVMFASSHTTWKKEDPDNLWWKAVAQNPWIREFCEKHPDLVMMAEVFGQVQDLKYGAKKNQIFCLAFDVWSKVENKYLDWDQIPLEYKYRVPLLFLSDHYDEGKILTFADGPSAIPGANNIREGIVIGTLKEQYNNEVGRKKLKLISNEYLIRSK